MDSDDHKRALILCFFQASSALLDVYTKDEISTYLDKNDLSPSPDHLRRRQKGRSDELAALYLVIAIGGQCRGLHPLDLEYAAKYFARAQQLAFEGMLCNPSVNMIRIFLLMAFYMLGACRRNAAFMYLGVASKAASALGLHRDDQYRNLQPEERSIRLRTWKSLRILDMLVSSILGRPRDSTCTRSDDTPLDDSPGEVMDSRRLALNATFELCSLIDGIEQKLLKDNRIEADAAEEFLRHLRSWGRNLPEELCHFRGERIGVSDLVDQEICVGATHVACVYYFAIILITRPFLISYLMSKLHQKMSDSVHDAGLDQAQQLQISKLSNVCLDSAIYMSNTCYNAIKSGFLLNNMCMIKAWVFAAGLVLGFSLFVQGTGSTNEIEEAYDAAREVLKKISYLSPQARHYHERLTHFSEATAKHQKRHVEQRRKSLNPYVSQIFTIDIDQPEDQTYPSPNLGSVDQSTAGVDLTNDLFGINEYPTMQLEDPMALPFVWDELSIDYQPYDTFWNGIG
ncbi:putative c6 transcription factor [Phaeomoniella chlamydospora]|uniref:Putative c6 transcription factor n=1 Tax=Phaeomoniella chlamydospora TaxID=158046 RepID=A0A0G2EWL6_PHACM|nr:putative c6 transcription factor [Phaeomoniella chlamydospora]